MAIYIGGTGGAGGGKRTCRFVVGTSTAGWTTKDCDYLCDGVSDEIEFNAAIKAMPLYGGEIVVLDGTYNITAAITVDKSYITLMGNGNNTVLKRMFGSDYYAGVIIVSENHCVVRDFQIHGNKQSYGVSYNAGISSNYNTIIQNNWIHDCAGDGVVSAGSSYQRVIGNRIVNCGMHGITQSGTDSFVNGNFINGCGDYGINITSSFERAIVSNNTVQSCQNAGIYFSGWESIVINNVCQDNIGDGIYGSGVTMAVISSNVCYKNKAKTAAYSSGNGISFKGNNSYVTIIGNTCRQNGTTSSVNGNGSGIFLGGNSAYITVSGNTCADHASTSSTNVSGIYAYGLSGSTINGNNCYNNMNGITLEASKSTTISGNSCFSSTEKGIYVVGNTFGCTITGNTVMRGNGITNSYTATQYTIYMGNIAGSSTQGRGNVVVGNCILGKNYTDAGESNTFANNKYS